MLNSYAALPEDVIVRLKCCKIIARTGIGVDTVDLEAASKQGIFVTNVPSYCEDEVSDHTLALVLACTRKVAHFSQTVKDGQWDWKQGKPILRLRGLTLGLVAFGKIARKVAKKAQAFGFNVVASDPFAPAAAFAQSGVERVEFGALLSRADVVSIHAPLVPETTHLFDDKVFSQMKRTAFLVNTSRGPIVDEQALYRALSGGQIAGAGLDVMEVEPSPSDHPLLQLDNVVLTPHVAFYSEDSLVDLRTQAAQEVARVLKGQRPLAVVNTGG